LLQHGPTQPRKEVPILKEFAPRFIENYARANRQKPSGIAAKQTVLKVHLIPLLGERRLNTITNEQVQRLKSQLAHRSPKTANNVLSVLSVLLKKAVEWDVIDRMPCAVRLLPIPKSSASFYDFDEYERLVAAADDRTARLILLLGGEAGLRCGEMMALEWSDLDLDKQQLRVERSDWKGHVTSTKGGRVRFVPLTRRLAMTLREHRHLRGRRVLTQADGTPLTQKIVQDHVRRAARRANVKWGVHRLRHTFCSHLAMCGAPARAIQELAGHQDLGTTQGYMHLSPAAIEGAIRLLELPLVAPSRGNSGATGSTEIANVSR
jgi:integrase